MKRIALLSIVVLAVVAATVASNAVGAGDTAGPKCADITDGQGGYDYYEADGTTAQAHPHFDFTITLASAGCKSITYTLYVSLDNGTPYPVQGTPSGTTVTFPTQTFDQTTAPGNVCVYAETTTNGGHVADRAPDPGSGCNTYTRGEFGGTLFH
jgi:hypothetical protein